MLTRNRQVVISKRNIQNKSRVYTFNTLTEWGLAFFPLWSQNEFLQWGLSCLKVWTFKSPLLVQKFIHVHWVRTSLVSGISFINMCISLSFLKMNLTPGANLVFAPNSVLPYSIFAAISFYYLVWVKNTKNRSIVPPPPKKIQISFCTY